MRHYNIAVAILAGGKNSRIGVDKAFIKIKNTFIIEHTIDILKKIFSEIMIITNSLQNYELYKKDCFIYPDSIKYIGPLGGILTALNKTSKQAVFFVACDMPFLHNELILQQIYVFRKINYDAVVPKVNGFIEPLHSIYKTKLKENLYNFITKKKSYSIQNFLETINVFYWNLPNNIAFKNLNTKDDVNEIGGFLCK